MFASIFRLKRLEERVAKIEQKDKCATGRHEWVMAQNSTWNPPYIRCSHCYATPPEEKKP